MQNQSLKILNTSKMKENSLAQKNCDCLIFGILDESEKNLRVGNLHVGLENLFCKSNNLLQGIKYRS